MVGEPIILDWRTWLRGMSSGTELDDGGFSPDTEGVNLITEPGVVHAPAARVDSDTDNRLTGTIIASSPDHATFLGDNRLLIGSDTDEDGTFYRYDGTKIIAAAYATDTTNNYAEGFTSIINYKGESYVTTKELIKRWISTGTISDLSGGGFTNTTFPHPAIVFEDNAYYGDGNLLLRQTAANGSPATILTLPSNDLIIALGVDPGTGKMLIATTSSLNISGTVPSRNLLQWYDGESSTVTKYVDVGEIINSFYNVGSTVFVGYGNNLGFVNGSGVQFLRRLKNVTFTQQELPYFGKITNIGNTLYVVDGDQVLAYGEILPGQKIFYYCLQNKASSDKFTAIFDAGNGSGSDTRKLGIAHETSVPAYLFNTVDLTDISGLDKFFFMTDWVYFPRPVTITNLQLEFFSDIVSTGNLSVIAFDSERDTHTIASLDGTITNRRVIRKMGGFPKRVDAIRFQIENSTTNAGLKRLLIYRKVLE